MLFVSIQKAAYLEQNDWRHILWVPDKAENTGDDGTHDEQAHAKVSMVSEMFWSRNIKRHMMWPPCLPFHLSFFPSCFWKVFVFAFGPCKKSHPQKQNASFCFCERPKARKDRPERAFFVMSGKGACTGSFTVKRKTRLFGPHSNFSRVSHRILIPNNFRNDGFAPRRRV